ncbi:hypothetical protein Pcinc_015965, partial [Petrolisthes cinctipes]
PRPCASTSAGCCVLTSLSWTRRGARCASVATPARTWPAPGTLSCTLEETHCDSEPCPPMPTCKQPRSLSSMCGLGDPLMVDERERRPFLCGTDPGKPQCPPLYRCHVAQGRDYGVCCAGGRRAGEAWPVSDGGRRRKCCISEICGQHCVQPANLTACLQQRMIAELLLVTEREGKGYVPQCREQDGLYEPRQCSRNVSSVGVLGPTDTSCPGHSQPLTKSTAMIPAHPAVPSFSSPPSLHVNSSPPTSSTPPHPRSTPPPHPVRSSPTLVHSSPTPGPLLPPYIHSSPHHVHSSPPCITPPPTPSTLPPPLVHSSPPYIHSSPHHVHTSHPSLLL